MPIAFSKHQLVLAQGLNFPKKLVVSKGLHRGHQDSFVFLPKVSWVCNRTPGCFL